MAHSRLGRAAWIFGGLAAAAILAFAALVDRAPSPAPPMPVVREVSAEELFNQHCGRCHEAGATAASLRGEPDRSKSREDAIEFLGGHGEASDQEDVLIVDFLLGRPDPRTNGPGNPAPGAGRGADGTVAWRASSAIGAVLQPDAGRRPNRRQRQGVALANRRPSASTQAKLVRPVASVRDRTPPSGPIAKPGVARSRPS